MYRPYRIMLTFLLLFQCPLVIAEQGKLEQKIAQYDEANKQLNGTALLKAYTDITYQEKQNNPDAALYYFDLAMRLIETHPDSTLESDLNTNIAWVYITKGDYDKASTHGKKALELGGKTNNYRRQHNAVTALGAVALYTGDTGTGLNYFKQALNFAKLGKVVENEATSLHNIAIIYTQLGELDSAIKYFITSRDLSIERNKLSQAAATEAQIGEIYALMGNFEKAIPYFETSIKTHETTNNTFYIAKAKVMLARTLSKVGRLEEAQQTIQQAITLLKSTGKDIHLRDELIASANIYLEQQNYQDAIAIYSEAMESAKKVKSDDEIHQVAYGLARAYWQLDDFDNALTFSNIALEKAIAVKNDIAEEQIKIVLAKVYASKQDYQNAYQNLLNSTQLNKRNSEKEISDKNEQTENRFQSAQKEKTIELLTKDNALKALELKQKDAERKLWISSLIIFLLSASFLIYRQKQKRQLVNERAGLMAELVDKKNQLLAEVSHELRTPLSVLHLKVEALQHNLVKDVDASYEGLITKIGEINGLISDIYQLAQSDIGALDLNIQSLQAVTTINTWFIEFAEIIERNGFESQQSIQLTSNLAFDADSEKVKQVLCNLIYNSIAYTDKPGTISLSVINKDNYLSFRVEDSSPGVEKDDLSRIFERLFRVESSRSRATGGSGLGLSICSSIIEAHKGTIVAKNSKLGGLAVTVKLPI